MMPSDHVLRAQFVAADSIAFGLTGGGFQPWLMAVVAEALMTGNPALPVTRSALGPADDHVLVVVASGEASTDVSVVLWQVTPLQVLAFALYLRSLAAEHLARAAAPPPARVEAAPQLVLPTSRLTRH